MQYTLLFLSFLLCANADITPTDVPTFAIRCRIVQIDGKPVPPERKTRFYLSGDRAGVVASGSDWSDTISFEISEVTATLALYPNLYLKRYPLVLHLRTLPVLTDYNIEVQARWLSSKLPGEAGDEKAGDGLLLEEPAPDLTLSAHLYGERLGLMLWRDEQGQPHLATMRQYNQRYWQVLADISGSRPKHFPIVDRFISGDNDIDALRDGITQLSHAGFSALMTPAGKEVRDILLSTGLRRTAWAVYNPPGYAFDHDPKVTPAAIEEWATAQAKPFLDSGYSGEDMALYAMSDEPGWYFPSRFQQVIANPVILQRFHDYLATQGLAPADVGAASWETVVPIGRSQATSLANRRLHYWTTRFYAWDSARHFATSTRALEKAFGAEVPIFVNWNFFSGKYWFPGPFGNNPDKDSPDAAMGCHDWFEFARLRGCTMLWTEDWFTDNRAWQWSYYASKLNSAARLGDIQFGGYVIPRTAGGRPDGILQKILTITGHGGKAIKYFVFGPEYNFPGNCYSMHAELLPKMAEAHAMIAAAEELLWPGHKAPSPVAILQPRSAFAWDPYDPKSPIVDATNNALERSTTGYMADTFGIYLALQHANIPVDWIDEDGIEAKTLASLKVLYITTPNIPTESLGPLLDWVSAGGTLVTTSGAITADRYNEPSNAFWAAAGLSVAPHKRLLIGARPKLPSVELATPAGNVPAIGAEKGSAPMLTTKLGDGTITHFTWLPGVSYFHSQDHTVDGLPRGFSEAIRTLLVAPITQAAVQPPVTTIPLVEGPLLLSEGGAALTLLNWSGAPLDSLPVSVRLPFRPASITAVKAGQLDFTTSDDQVHFSLPLASADILLIRK